MKHITHHYNEDIFISSVLDFYFKDMKAGVLDIETTGLNPSRNKFILGGLYDIGGRIMHQVFAENSNQEKEALQEFMQEVSKLDLIITYNGRHFDLPFLQKRMQTHGIESSLPYNLDLYLVINGHSPIKKFVPNLKQKTIENYMGLWQTRTDEISGAESVTLYYTYERTSDPALEEKILLHNSDDVLQLTRLLKVVSKCDFHKAMFHLGFPAGPLTVEKIRIEGDSLMVFGSQRAIHMDYMGFFFEDFPAESRFESRTAAFSMKIPIIRDSGLCIMDLEAAGLDPAPFEKYPGCSSGFLVLENQNTRNFMEINHFVKSYLERFLDHIN